MNRLTDDRTAEGIAEAMAEQWGDFLDEQNKNRTGVKTSEQTDWKTGEQLTFDDIFKLEREE